MLGALDAPDDVKGRIVESHLLGVSTQKLSVPGNTVPTGRRCRPQSLQRADGDTRYAAAEFTGDVDRRASHAASHIAQGVAVCNTGFAGERFRQALGRGPGRLLGVPQAVMNVPSPD